MQVSALLLLWGSYRRARNLRVLIVYLFFLPVMLPFVLPKLGTDSAVRRFPKTPFPGRNSVPPSFVPFLVFYIFSYLLSKTWVAFLGAWCPLPAFRSCFVEFTQRLNVLLMNLWGRKCSPHPIPLPSWLLPGKVLIAQSCPIVCDPMDCSPPGSSVHGILQARILEWVAISFSRGSYIYDC